MIVNDGDPVCNKVVVLSGSPKGENGVTLQSARFLERHAGNAGWRYFHVAQRILSLETNGKAFEEIVEAVAEAELVLWVFPVYILHVHAALKRFIELLFERNAQRVFAGKYAAAISTSIHYFDHTAHRYVHAVSEDLGMRFAGYFSAGMHDLIRQEEQQSLLRFFRDVCQTVTTRREVSRRYPPLDKAVPAYLPGPACPHPTELGALRAIIVTDGRDMDTNLGRMVERVRASCSGGVEVVDLQTLDMKGHCLGCIHCGAQNKCVHDDRDGVRALYGRLIADAEILVFAAEVKDRFLSARWKQFLDRRFFNTHQRLFTGKQMAWILSGQARRNDNLLDVLQAMAEWDLANLTELLFDEEIQDSQLDGLLPRMADLARHAHVKPATFLGRAGMKVFRDEIWGGLRMVFPMDHRVYRKTGVYDFPQKHIRMRLANAIALPLLRIPFFRVGMQRGMIQAMSGRQKQVVEAVVPISRRNPAGHS